MSQSLFPAREPLNLVADGQFKPGAASSFIIRILKLQHTGESS